MRSVPIRTPTPTAPDDPTEPTEPTEPIEPFEPIEPIQPESACPKHCLIARGCRIRRDGVERQRDRHDGAPAVTLLDTERAAERLRALTHADQPEHTSELQSRLHLVCRL